MYNYEELYLEIANKINLQDRYDKYFATNSKIEKVKLLDFFFEEFNICIEQHKSNNEFKSGELLTFCIERFYKDFDNDFLDFILLNFLILELQNFTNSNLIQIIALESLEKKLFLSTKKVESLFLLFRKKDLDIANISLVKNVFLTFLHYDTTCYFKLLIDLLFQTNKPFFQRDFIESNYTHNYINLNEFDEYLRIVFDKSTKEDIFRIILPIYENLLNNSSNPFLLPIDDKLYYLEKELDLSSINELNSIQNRQKLIEQIDGKKEEILNGSFYVKDLIFSYSNSIFENLSPNTNELNFVYNNFNLDFEYFIKNLVKTTNLNPQGFKISIESEFGINEGLFKKRLNIKWLMSKYFDFIYPTTNFNLKLTFQLTDAFTDFLVISYLKLYLIKKSAKLPFTTINENYSKIEEAINTIKELDFVKTKLKIEEIIDNETINFSDFTPVDKISSINLINREIDILKSLSYEKLEIRFLNGQKTTLTIVCEIPLRHLILLSLEISIFDGIDFTFFERLLDFSSNSLRNNPIENILKFNCDSLGLILNCIKNNELDIKSELKHLELIEFFNWFNPLIDYNFKNEIAEKDKYIDYILSIPLLREEEREFIFAKNLNNKKPLIQFTNEGDVINNLESIHNNFTLSYFKNTVALQLHPHFANQFSRLNITRTPGDLEFWVTKAERQAISDKNDYRENMIRNENKLASETFNNSVSLKRFCEFIQLSSFSWYEQDLTVIDYVNNEIFSVLRSSCPFYPSGNLTEPIEEVCYFRNRKKVFTEPIEKIYLMNLIYPNFVKDFNIDLSDLTTNGINYFLKLYEIIIENNSYFLDDLNYHCLNIFHPIYFMEEQTLSNPSGNIFTIENDYFTSVLSIVNNVFLEERICLNSFFSTTIQLKKYTHDALNDFFIQYKTNMTSTVNEKLNNFDANFEPKLNEWNNSFYISITIGSGNSNYGFFSFNNGDFKIPVIPVFNF